MKKIFIALLTLASFAANAQKNVFLDQSFWQTSPDVNAVKEAIAKGNNPTESSSNSMDAVVIAINAQAPNESVKYLLSLPGNNVDKLTHDGRIYLHWAASRGNDELVNFLLDKGSKKDFEDANGTTPLLFSTGQQNTKLYDAFVAHGTDLKKVLNKDGANLLLLSIANDKDLALTNYFITKGLDLNSTDLQGNNAFSYAARSGNVDLLKTLVQKGVKPNEGALLMAAQAGGGRRGGPATTGANLAFYQYLESLGIKATAISKNGENILHAVAKKPNQTDIIQYFLAKGIDVNKLDAQGNNVLMSAASANRDTLAMGLLLAKTADINLANLQGLTALTFAVRSNSPEMVNYLIAKGANVKVLDKKGNNLAYYAIDSYRGQGFGGQGGGRPDGQVQNATAGAKLQDYQVKLATLKQHGLNIAAGQTDGNTLYHLAIAKNDISLLKGLEPFQIDINAKNKEGMTILHKATLVAKDDVMLKYLLSIGAKKEVVTGFGETAFDLAKENESLTKNKVDITFLK